MVINFVNKKSSPGIDGIDYLIVSHFPESAREILLVLFNEFFALRLYPAEWKDFLIFCIPKNETKRKFRPIALASCLQKITERLICNRLNWWLETKHLFPSSQFGFRKNNSVWIIFRYYTLIFF